MIAIVSGTNRKGSRSLQIARLLEEAYLDAGEEVVLLDLAQLPLDLFRPESYGAKPAAFIEGFVNPVLAADGLHVVTPEYNGSFPGALKYFIDMLPFPQSFESRPTAFVGISAGMNGALRPVEQLQMVFGYRNAYIYPRRVFIPRASAAIDGEGHLVDADLDQRLRDQVTGFMAYIRQLKS